MRALLLSAFATASPRLAATRSAATRQLGSQLAEQARQLGSAAPRARPRLPQLARGRAFAGFAGHDKSFNNATPAEVNQQLQAGACRYLDVRTPEEFNAGHVPGSMNIPVWNAGGPGMTPNPDFLKQVEAAFMDKGVPLVVGCKSGRRSETACQLMTQAGFVGLTNMLGGFDAWAAEGLPVEK